jgi:hypothetical protein
MKLDIRLPIGTLFALLGVMLTVFGAASNKGLYQRSLGININLVWGVVMLVFGLTMIALGRRRVGSQEDTAGPERPGAGPH